MKLLICFILALASLTAADKPFQSGTWSRFGITKTYRSWKDAPASPTRKLAAGSNSRCASCARTRPPRATASSGSQSGSRSASRCESCARTASGRIARSPAARRQFQRENPCPSTGMKSGACPGYVVDHIVALKHGAADEPGNMQWQTVAEAKVKDRVE